MPVQREKMTGRRPVRKMVGIRTVTAYLNAAQCRESKLDEDRDDFFGDSAGTRAALWVLQEAFTSHPKRPCESKHNRPAQKFTAPRTRRPRSLPWLSR